jgi:hypothetical protein
VLLVARARFDLLRGADHRVASVVTPSLSLAGESVDRPGDAETGCPIASGDRVAEVLRT